MLYVFIKIKTKSISRGIEDFVEIHIASCVCYLDNVESALAVVLLTKTELTGPSHSFVHGIFTSTMFYSCCRFAAVIVAGILCNSISPQAPS